MPHRGLLCVCIDLGLKFHKDGVQDRTNKVVKMKLGVVWGGRGEGSLTAAVSRGEKQLGFPFFNVVEEFCTMI